MTDSEDASAFYTFNAGLIPCHTKVERLFSFPGCCYIHAEQSPAQNGTFFDWPPDLQSITIPASEQGKFELDRQMKTIRNLTRIGLGMLVVAILPPDMN